MNVHPPPTETEFVFNGFRYACQLWNQSCDQSRESSELLPALALHGWLDNSGSFDVLAPLLADVQMLAPDLAGHGYSDHRQGLSDYPIWSETTALFAIADAMGWQRFALIGHSRGAMMATLLAATFPERISHLILLDALAPLSFSADSAPERMVKSIEELHYRINRPPYYYPDYDAAIEARCQSTIVKVTRKSAEILATRGLLKHEKGYHWHVDGKLWATTNVALTAEQVQAFIQRITANTLVLLGKQGMRATFAAGSANELMFRNFIEWLNPRVQEFDDGHYLHMETSARSVAQAIQRFLANDYET